MSKFFKPVSFLELNYIIHSNLQASVPKIFKGQLVKFREEHSKTFLLLLFDFLAAKAQLNTCTFLFFLSVQLSVLNLNFSLFGPYLTANDNLWQLLTAYDSF